MWLVLTMAHGVPPNAASMSHAKRRSTSVLTLEFEVLDDRPDWPVVSIRVDGADPFAGVAKGWRGFDPDKILGSDSPLLPVDNGRRVAVHTCSCGEAGCGVIAPYIVAAPDRSQVSWVDFRDYVGVFVRPTARDLEDDEGRPWDLADIHFDRDQYLDEIRRASNDRSWETHRRRIARLLRERLEPMDLVLPPNLTLSWASPAWVKDGVVVMFQRVSREPEISVQQQMLHLTSDRPDPEDAAEHMAEQFLAVSPDHWVDSFGHEVD